MKFVVFYDIEGTYDDLTFGYINYYELYYNKLL